MRTSPAGQKGRFSCDRCGKDSPRGVYTGVKGFEHVCPPCKSLPQSLLANANPLLDRANGIQAPKAPSKRRGPPLAALAALKAKRQQSQIAT
jgi:hypothetical protein